MAKGFKLLGYVACSFAFSCCAVGYAAVSDTLSVSGTAKAEPTKAVLITKAERYFGDVTVRAFSLTTLSTTVDLGSPTGNATVSVTVYNNAEQTMAYNAVKYVVGGATYDNENISFELQDIQKGTEIAVGASLTFKVNFFFAQNAASTANTLLNSVLGFEFVPPDQIETDDEIAVADVTEKFKNILNTPASLSQLNAQMDAIEANDRHDDSYIGTVLGASEEDVTLLNNLFEGQFNVNINGSEKDVTVMIKREDLTGDGVEEMTIYMTTDALSKRGDTPPVYASVYTQNADGEWEQIGQMWEGTAKVNHYSGWPYPFSSGTGSFDTDSWRSTNNKTISQMVASV